MREEPGEERVLTPRLRPDAPGSLERRDEAFAGEQRRLQAADLRDVPVDASLERDDVAGVDRERLAGLEVAAFDRAVTDASCVAVNVFRKNDSSPSTDRLRFFTMPPPPRFVSISIPSVCETIAPASAMIDSPLRRDTSTAANDGRCRISYSIRDTEARGAYKEVGGIRATPGIRTTSHPLPRITDLEPVGPDGR